MDKDKMLKPFEKLGAFVTGPVNKLFSKDKEKGEGEVSAEQPKPMPETKKKSPYYTTDKFWLTRWFRDWRYKRVGFTTVTWMGEEYGYRVDIDRIPRSQLNAMRHSQPFPVHKSGHGWNDWVMYKDETATPFTEVCPADVDFENKFCNHTAADLYLYMVDNSIDNALTFKKKSDVNIDGKLLLIIVGAVAVLAFFMMGALY